VDNENQQPEIIQPELSNPSLNQSMPPEFNDNQQPRVSNIQTSPSHQPTVPLASSEGNDPIIIKAKKIYGIVFLGVAIIILPILITEMTQARVKLETVSATVVVLLLSLWSSSAYFIRKLIYTDGTLSARGILGTKSIDLRNLKSVKTQSAGRSGIQLVFQDNLGTKVRLETTSASKSSYMQLLPLLKQFVNNPQVEKDANVQKHLDSYS